MVLIVLGDLATIFKGISAIKSNLTRKELIEAQVENRVVEDIDTSEEKFKEFLELTSKYLKKEDFVDSDEYSDKAKELLPEVKSRIESPLGRVISQYEKREDVFKDNLDRTKLSFIEELRYQLGDKPPKELELVDVIKVFADFNEFERLYSEEAVEDELDLDLGGLGKNQGEKELLEKSDCISNTLTQTLPKEVEELGLALEN